MGAVTALGAARQEAQRLIKGRGTPEQAWQAWPGLSALPQVGVDELVPPGRRAVIVAPHPDDEVLGAGGLMAQLASRGREVLLVAVTDGEASHPGSSRWSRHALAQQRPVETLKALDALGLERIRMIRLGWPDGAVAQDEAGLVAALDPHLRADDVVVSTWRFDGHPDHEATGRACATWAAGCGAELLEMPIWSWHWATPCDPRLPWSQAVSLPLGPVVAARKRQAVQAFATQIDPDPTSREGCVLPPHVLARLLRGHEVFFRNGPASPSTLA